MANEQQGFKTVRFGGFDKQYVLNYIEYQKQHEAQAVAAVEAEKQALLSENVALKEELSALRDELAQREVLPPPIAVDNEVDTEFPQDNYIELPTEEGAELSALRVLVEKKNEELSSALEQAAALNEKISKLSAANDEKTAEIISLKSELEALTSELARAREKCRSYEDNADRLSGLEAQLGSAMIDARRFADKLIDDAKAKADSINSHTLISLGTTRAKVESLSNQIKEVSDSMAGAYAQLSEKMNSLTAGIDSVTASIENGKLNNTEN